jgi:glutathione reductase (NADPH)
MEHYDVFILGTGTAGKLVANRCTDAGKKVGIIDNRDYGGTCSQRGCDPKKLMLAATEAYDLATNIKGDGIDGDVTVSWNEMYNYARRYTSDIPKNTEEQLKEMGVDCYMGDGHFEDEKTFTFGDQSITADTFVIATGMIPIPLSIPGQEHLLTSDDVFKLSELPEKVVFIGGGYIGMEFSHMMARAGAKVTIIEETDQLISPFEKYTAGFLEDASRDLGIDIRLDSTAVAIEQSGDRYVLHYNTNGSMHQITAGLVFNTAGRKPAIDSLQLENAGVVTDTDGIVVNDYLQSTTQSHFYACGDVSSKNLPLTPLSGLEANIVAKNITEGKHKFEPVIIPSVTFTIPQVASIGMTEGEARKSTKKIEVREKDASGWFNTRRINAGVYAYKIIIDTDTELLLGAHVIAHEAAEMINILAVAMNHDIKFKHLQQTIFTYPSWGNDIKSF